MKSIKLYFQNLIKKLVIMNKGEQSEYPKFCFDDVKTVEVQKTEAETQKVKMEVIQTAKEAGFVLKDLEALENYVGLELVPIEVEVVEPKELTLEDINPDTNLPYTQEELDKLKIKTPMETED